MMTETAVPIWCILCITEAVAIKAAMATKFKYIGGINDDFFGDFLFTANLGFVTVSTFGMYFLCTLQLDIMIFTGEWVGTENAIQIFWPVFLLMTFVITGISGTVLIIKKNVEKKKDQRILNNICVNLDKNCYTIQKINNNKFNKPIVNIVELFVYGLTGIGALVLFMILEWMESNSFIWFYLVICFIIKILWPCIGLCESNDFTAFLWRTLNDVWAIITYIVSTSVQDRSQRFSDDQVVIRRISNSVDEPTNINFVINATPMTLPKQTVAQNIQKMTPQTRKVLLKNLHNVSYSIMAQITSH